MGMPSGSIPACAGEPEHGGMVRRRRRVYPRVCGGTGNAVVDTDSAEGLSPRVRGNRQPLMQWGFGGRSIPACAGEPKRRLA